jgi:23S rRNA-/tRNA-specific pseudouridylate synthase
MYVHITTINNQNKAKEKMKDDTDTTRNKQSHDLRYKIPILFKSRDLVVINKPFDTCLAGDFKFSVLNLMNHSYYNEFVLLNTKSKAAGDRKFRIVHTLDYETSGCMVLALTKQIAGTLAEAFAKRSIHKYYLALVYGHVDIEQVKKRFPTSSDDTMFTMRTFIVNNQKKKYFDPLEQFEPDHPDANKCGKEAISDFIVLEYRRLKTASEREIPITKLLVKIHTGRRHQIRLHCSLMGHPIVGDTIYAASRPDVLEAPRMMLHAYLIKIQAEEKGIPGVIKKGQTLTVCAVDALEEYIDESDRAEVISMKDIAWLQS